MNSARLFLAGEVDVVDLGGGIILSRERTKNKCDLWHFSDGEKDIKQIWVKRERKIVKGKVEEEPEDKEDFQTGGQEPYSMSMDRNFQSLVRAKDKQGDLMRQFGLLLMLQYYAEFGTGRIVNRRTKDPLTREQIGRIADTKLSKLDKLLRDMKHNGLIERRDDGYYISRRFIKKGAKK